MGASPMLFLLACAAAIPTGRPASETIGSYGAVMQMQYTARSAPMPQRAEEAKRIYDAYLNSIGESTKNKSDNSSGDAGGTSH